MKTQLNQKETFKSENKSFSGYRSADEYIDAMFNNKIKKQFSSRNLKILSEHLPEVKKAIQSVIKSHLGHRIKIKDIADKINEEFSTDFKSTTMCLYSLKQLGINWREEVNRELGLHKINFKKLAEQALDDTHKSQCIAMENIKDGLSFSEIERKLNLKHGIVGKWFRAYIKVRNK